MDKPVQVQFPQLEEQQTDTLLKREVEMPLEIET